MHDAAKARGRDSAGVVPTLTKKIFTVNVCITPCHDAFSRHRHGATAHDHRLRVTTPSTLGTKKLITKWGLVEASHNLMVSSKPCTRPIIVEEPETDFTFPGTSIFVKAIRWINSNQPVVKFCNNLCSTLLIDLNHKVVQQMACPSIKHNCPNSYCVCKSRNRPHVV